MIVLLLSYSSSWCQSNFDTCTSPTGEVEEIDSILVPIEFIKIANGKMVELKYEKEINKNLRDCIQKDSILIDALSNNLSACEIAYNKKDFEIKKIKKQRNIAIEVGSGISLLLLIILTIL